MPKRKYIHQVAWCIMLFFAWVILTLDYSFAQEESPLVKAQALFSQGQYDEAVTVLNGYIGELKMKPEQKPNMAAACYLLAKIYFEVGDDAKCDEALLTVFSALPGFDRDEPNYGFRERVTKAKAQLAGNLPGGAETTTQPVIPQKEIETKEIKTDNPPITTGTYINGILTVSGVRYDMAAITAGEFLMGNNSAGAYPDEQPAHTVRIAQSFRLGKTEVTQGLWQAVMGNNPSGFPNDSTYPVERVSWDDCQAFMQKLNQMVGGNHFRLPTESEWEYACRAGTMNDPYANGDDMAWYSINSGRSTHPVGQKQAGPWGLFDMLGNVWEWCQDWYAGYSNGNQTDPPGPASGSNRVYRGGSWSSDACVVRSTYRGGDEPPGYRSWRLGFRLASD